MDCDQLAAQQKMAAGVDMSENGQGLSALREVGPGQHYLGCEHTQANFKSAFYMSDVCDNNSFEQWTEDGASDMAQRANAKWKRMLNDYQPPELDPAIDEALIAFMEARKASFPDSNI